MTPLESRWAAATDEREYRLRNLLWANGLRVRLRTEESRLIVQRARRELARARWLVTRGRRRTTMRRHLPPIAKVETRTGQVIPLRSPARFRRHRGHGSKP